MVEGSSARGRLAQSRPAARIAGLRRQLGAALLALRERVGPRAGGLLAWAAVVVVLACVQGPALWASYQQALDPSLLSDDARQQIPPFFRYFDAGLLANDYIADYYLDCYPLGYWGLYAGAAQLGLDPVLVSRVLPHLLWLATAVLLAVVAQQLGGKLAAFCVVALSLGTDAYLVRIGGGLPRSFGFPVLALALAGLARARAGWCVASVILGAAFYPVTGVISGMALTASLLLPRRWRCGLGEWPLRRRLALLGGTAAIAVALLLPVLWSSTSYGAAVRPDEVSAFPEIGDGGRYYVESRAPFKGFIASVPDGLEPALLGGGEPWLEPARAWLLAGARTLPESGRYRTFMNVLFALALAGGVGLVVHAPAARRVALLGLASAVGYQISAAVVPHAYLPERYAAYTAPLLGTVLVSIGIGGLFASASARARWRRARQLALALNVALVLTFCGARVQPGAGLDVELQYDQPLLARIAELPKNALIAGWPKGLLDVVPYAARRPALVTYETHQAFHRGYIEEMRRRMRALIDAYFGTSVEPIERLRDEFGVTHLLVQRSHYGSRAPWYFAPFGMWAWEQREAAGDEGYEVPRQLGSASIFASGDYELLELARVGVKAAARAP